MKCRSKENATLTPKPLHHREANRIREREVLVAVGFENSYCSSFVIGRRTHHDGRARDHIPEHLSCRVSTPSRQHERVEFREAESGCDRGKATHGNSVRDQLACPVVRVRRVRKRVERRGIDEHVRSVGPGSACAHSFGGLCVSARYRYLSDDTGGSTASDPDRSGMWRSSWKSGSSAPRMPVFLRGRRGDTVPTLTSTVSPSKTCLTTCTCPVARAAETNCAMSGSPAGMSAGVLSIATSLRNYGGDFDLFKSTSSGSPIPRPRQYGLALPG